MKLFGLRRGGQVIQSYKKGREDFSQSKGMRAGPGLGAVKEVCWLRWRLRRRVKGRCQPRSLAGGEPSSWSSCLGNEAVGWSYWRLSLGSRWPREPGFVLFFCGVSHLCACRDWGSVVWRRRWAQPGPCLILLMLLGGPLAGLAANRPVCGGNAACLCAETHLDGEETSPELLSEFPNVAQRWERTLSDQIRSVAQSCPTLCDPWVSRVVDRRFTVWATREVGGERCQYFLISSEAVYMVNSEHRFECRLDMDLSPWIS